MTTATTILQTQTVAASNAGWLMPLSFTKFDPTLGTLLDVRVGITGTVTGTASIENLGATAAEVLIQLPGAIDVLGPANAALASARMTPAAAVTLAAYDGTSDFAGASGTIVSGISNTATVVSLYSPGTAGLAPFVGTGMLDLTAASSASVTETAYGNVLSLTQAQAGATITMQYDYLAAPSGSSSGGGSSGVVSYLSNPVIFFAAAIANEQTTAAQTLIVADTATGWNTTLTANQFNPALGTLEAVNLTLISDINAGLAVENLGSAPAAISMTETAGIRLSLPGTIGVIESTASISAITNLGAFDGTNNFDGTSGSSVNGLTNVGTVTSQIAAASADLSSFIGSGTLALSLGASSPSSLSGTAANLESRLLTQAGAVLAISYVYVPATTPGGNPGATASVISGATAGQIVTAQMVTGQATIAPFANIKITDPNAGQTESVTVTLSTAANGILGNLGGGSYNATIGVYSDTGSPTAVTAALNGLVFTPKPHQIASGQTVTTGFTIQDTNSGGASVTNALTSVMAATGEARHATNDFSGQGITSDILFRDNATGESGYFALQPGGVSGTWVGFGPSSIAYAVSGIGDFSGNGTAGILFHDSTTGDTGYFTLPPGGGQGSWHDLGQSSTAFSIVANGDFTGTGTSDLLFQDTATGDMGVYLLNAAGSNTWQGLGTPSLLYAVAGVGDFTGNGKSDILFQNTTSGDIGYYAVSSAGGQGLWVGLGTASTAYAVVGVGDFNGDGTADILFRDKATGDTGYLAMPTTGGQGNWVDLGLSATAYSVVSVGDYTGTGTADILFRDNATGDTGYLAPGAGGGQSTWHDLGSPSTAYTVAASPTYG